jgi:Flp pilus assembly protein TadD
MIYAKVIGPGTADIARYEVTIPEGGFEVRAALMWRKFNRGFTEFVFEKLELPIPDLPITEIAADTLFHAPPDGPPEWIRYNDYGIGLFLQGDTVLAAEAFGRVAELVPDRPDGFRNLARLALLDGDVETAVAHLEEAEKRSPGDPQNAFFFASAFRLQGHYDDAERAFLACLDAFPKDRVAWKQLGKLRFLDGRFPSALDAFQAALAIDPEDFDAHFHRMKCYQAMGDRDAADEAEKAYLKYKLDDNAPKVARKYLRENEDMNREAQKVHVHRQAAPR